ncbi:DinB family protein [Agrococcus carbonis]|uniref:TIGR03086 family protein n=1 Tax=Agrococcus carbonis TaxID=684552 RepID=A0A1H1NAU3_9MICO|nr:DUF664 domain-containing protein [Agrococcus carbonis]SDR95459.1 TIGR03086 family protein [Agrococcus carbonis]
MGTARDRYLQALDLFSAEARAGADRLGLPTACSEWSIADVVRHVTAVQSAHAGAALLGRVPGEREESADHRAAMAAGGAFEVIDVWEALAAQLRHAAHEADEDAFSSLALATFDMALHAWDVRWAGVRVGLGANLDFPDALLAWMDRYRERADDTVIRAPGVFGPALEPPADATPSERIAAWTGRQARIAYAPLTAVGA